MKRTYLVVVLLFIVILSINAASLEETLEVLSGDAARNYVKPMVTSFGSDMNSGWFHKVPAAKLLGWDLEFGFVFMGTMFTDKDDDFSVDGKFRFTEDQARELIDNTTSTPIPPGAVYDALVEQIISQEFPVEIAGPTITGPSYDDMGTANPDDDLNYIYIYFPEKVFTVDNNSYTVDNHYIKLPFGGLLEDVSFMPLTAPQLSIGTVYGTQLSFRYLPEVELTPEIGNLKYSGFGIQHNPKAWIPVDIPADFALAFFTQNMEIGSVAEASASTYGINVAKTFGAKLLSVTPYLGLSGESSKMKFHYEYPTGSTSPGVPETVKIKFDVKGKNTSKVTTGLSFRIALVNLNFDYNIARYPSASMGMMFNFSW